MSIGRAEMTKPDIWVSYGKTESGDDLTILLWDVRPTMAEVDTVYEEIYPEEYDEVGFVNFNIDLAIWANK
jgi:hypothetical protein